MKALVCTSFGMPDTLSYGELDTPFINDNQVLIKVKCCGVNFPDSLIIQNKYQFKPELPFAPGGEVSGLIEQVGKQVKHLKIGDRVFALTGWGGMAEYVAADSHKCLKMPEKMDFETGATTMYTFGTSLHALKQRAQIQKNETLVVLGAAGGVGLAAVQIGKLLGAKVLAAVSTAEKAKLCLDFGADESFIYQPDTLKDQIKTLTDGDGADVIFDPVGDVYSESAFRAMAWQGRYLVVGFAGGKPSALPMNLPLLKGAAVVGVFWGAFAQKQMKESQENFEQILKWISTGEIKHHIHKKYPLQKGAEAIRDLMDRKVLGKHVVMID